MEFLYQDFDLLIEPPLVKLLASVDGTRTADGEALTTSFTLPADFDAAEVETLVMQTVREAEDRALASRSEEWVRAQRLAVQKAGQLLFDGLFPASSPLLYSYLRSFMPPGTSTPGRQVRLRLRLRINPALGQLPWEIVHASRHVVGGDLALNASVVRSPTTDSAPADPIDLQGPLVVLLVADSPYAAEKERLEAQADVIREGLADLVVEGLVRILELAPRPYETSTAQSIERTLTEEKVHILHFMGHGYYTFDQDEPLGYLEMTRNGAAYDYSGPEVAECIQAGVNRALRLVVLNACEGARSHPPAKSLAFGGVAQAILDAGVPAVLAMQYEISDRAARAVAANFYRRLIQTGSVDEAVRHTRYHLLDTLTETLEWVTPVLFLTGNGQPFNVQESRRPLAVPHQFESYIADKTRRFIGREYVFAAIDAFIEGHENGYFEIEGDPGVGKSAILAEYVRRNGLISHFNIRAQGINSARHFLESLCTQLIQRFQLPHAALPPNAMTDGSVLNQLLEEAAASLAAGERLIIAVDALDEVDDATADPNSLQNILFLPRTLPPHVYFVLTRRQLHLPLTVHTPRQLLDLMDYTEESRQDVQAYIWRALEDSPELRNWVSSREPALTDEAFTLKLTELSECNFMYLSYVLPTIARGTYEDLSVDRLPAGLEEYYRDHWRRMGMERRPLPRIRYKIVYILGRLIMPTDVAMIASFAGEGAFTVQEVLADWNEFLREEVEEGTVYYSIYHASFRDFLHRDERVKAIAKEEKLGGDIDSYLQYIDSLIADDLWEGWFGPEG